MPIIQSPSRLIHARALALLDIYQDSLVSGMNIDLELLKGLQKTFDILSFQSGHVNVNSLLAQSLIDA